MRNKWVEQDIEGVAPEGGCEQSLNRNAECRCMLLKVKEIRILVLSRRALRRIWWTKKHATNSVQLTLFSHST